MTAKKKSSKRSRKSSKPKATTLNRRAKPPKIFVAVGVYGVDSGGRLWDLGRYTPKSAR